MGGGPLKNREKAEFGRGEIRRGHCLGTFQDLHREFFLLSDVLWARGSGVDLPSSQCGVDLRSRLRSTDECSRLSSFVYVFVFFSHPGRGTSISFTSPSREILAFLFDDSSRCTRRSNRRENNDHSTFL